jgi:hypothetical protein
MRHTQSIYSSTSIFKPTCSSPSSSSSSCSSRSLLFFARVSRRAIFFFCLPETDLFPYPRAIPESHICLCTTKDCSSIFLLCCTALTKVNRVPYLCASAWALWAGLVVKLVLDQMIRGMYVVILHRHRKKSKDCHSYVWAKSKDLLALLVKQHRYGLLSRNQQRTLEFGDVGFHAKCDKCLI